MKKLYSVIDKNGAFITNWRPVQFEFIGVVACSSLDEVLEQNKKDQAFWEKFNHLWK